MTLIYPGAVSRLPLKPRIRWNSIFRFWICSSDHCRMPGALEKSRRIQGVGGSPLIAFERWRQNVDFERMEGGIV